MAAQLVDIGINLMHRSFSEDREQVIDRAGRAGVTALIITGTSVRASRAASAYASRRPGVLYATAGVHPHDAKGCDGSTIGSLRALCSRPEVVAVGECGLDYDRDFSPRDVQQEWFEAQLRLAEELGMPLFLHERAAFRDFRDILARHRGACTRAVVHCFTGTRQELEAYLELGCHIGITGWICDERRGGALRALVPSIPADRLMIETDAPFLMPRSMPGRPSGGRNEPAFLTHIAEDMARLRGVSVESLCETTTANARRFFGL